MTETPVTQPPHDAYATLRSAIVRGDFAPDQRLIEADLVALLGVSRAAVRTIMIRLEQEGLVVREPHRGARVRKVGVVEAVEMTEARAVLEALAARYAARRATAADVAALREIHDRMRACVAEGDLLGYSDANAKLHATILAVSGHATLQRIVAGLKAQIVRFQYRTVMVPGRQARSLEEHGRIVAAVAAHDEDAAEATMRGHLDNVAATLGDTAAAQDQSIAVSAEMTH